MEHVIRQCLIALRLAERLGMDEDERVVLYYAGLLAWVGCHTDAYEQAKWFGDDMTLKSDTFHHDFGRAGPSLAFMLKYMGGPGRSLVERARVGVAFVGSGRRDMLMLAENHYRAADQLAERLGLGEEVRAALAHTFERWDGKGPLEARGEDVRLTARLVNLADVVEVYHRVGGVDTAIAVARERSATQFDPALVELFCDQAPGLLEGLEEQGGWDAVHAAEPALERKISDAQFDDALAAIADFIDLKSPWTAGHSRGVADLAVQAARVYGLPEPDAHTLRRAALMHDIGRLGISNAIWDKRGALTQGELERVRLQPYLTERMLSFSPTLAPLAAVAVQHHERLDGSGYPRRLAGDAVTPSGRILAAADVYHALSELRPHRPARTPEEAASTLRAEVAAGRLDGEAADAVLRAAGHRVRPRREWPAGLTPREVEVLRLLARGLSNKEIAAQLVISRKTAGSHIEHIYAKTRASNRAQASLFAVNHGLLAR